MKRHQQQQELFVSVERKRRYQNLELTISQMTWQMENVQNLDTQIQPAIVQHMDMTSNLIITVEIAPTDVMHTTNLQQSITC